MIDNYQKAMALILEMQKAVPFDAYPAKQLANLLKKTYPHFNTDTKISIKSVHYAGDEGGVMCHGSAEQVDNLIAVSLTHLTIDVTSPFYKAAKTYQDNRIKKLFRQNRRF